MKTLGTVVRLATALILALVGIGMAAPGGYLVSLGGSPYYLIAGLLIFVAAILLFLRRREGFYLYGLVLVATSPGACSRSGSTAGG